MAFNLYKLESPSSKDVLCQVWMKLAQWFCRNRFLNIFNIILLFCYYYSLGEGLGPSFLRNLNPLYRRMLCAMFGLNWPSGSGEKDFLNVFNIILLFCYYLPLENVVAFHLNKLESPPPKNALCQVWLKLAQWFWRRRIFFKF